MKVLSFAIARLGNHPLAAHLPPSLTHMEIPSQQLGSQAVKLLIEPLETPQQARYVQLSEVKSQIRCWKEHSECSNNSEHQACLLKQTRVETSSGHINAQIDSNLNTKLFLKVPVASGIEG
jgi:hypothetical protein